MKKCRYLLSCCLLLALNVDAADLNSAEQAMQRDEAYKEHSRRGYYKSAKKVQAWDLDAYPSGKSSNIRKAPRVKSSQVKKAIIIE